LRPKVVKIKGISRNTPVKKTLIPDKTKEPGPESATNSFQGPVNQVKD